MRRDDFRAKLIAAGIRPANRPGEWTPHSPVRLRNPIHAWAIRTLRWLLRLLGDGE